MLTSIWAFITAGSLVSEPQTITDVFFYSPCSWKKVDPTKLFFSKSSGVSVPLLYPLKPRICQHFPTKAYWKQHEYLSIQWATCRENKTTTL